MLIKAKIFSSDLVEGWDDVSDIDIRASGYRYAELLVAALAAYYPDANVESDVRHDVGGYGAGVTCESDEGERVDWLIEDNVSLIAREVYGAQEWIVTREAR